MDKTNDTIAGLRYQKYDSGEVHVHDDKKNIKFIADADDFKKDLETALKSLKDDDGVVTIGGKGTPVLYLIPIDKKVQAFVVDPSQDVTKDLKDFLKKL